MLFRILLQNPSDDQSVAFVYQKYLHLHRNISFKLIFRQNVFSQHDTGYNFSNRKYRENLWTHFFTKISLVPVWPMIMATMRTLDEFLAVWRNSSKLEILCPSDRKIQFLTFEKGPYLNSN